MKNFEEIQKKLESMKPRLEEEYGVEEIGIFGSWVRNEETESSDLDVLITFEKPIGLLELVHMENEISDRLNVDVDLVTKKSLKPRIRDHVSEEVIYT